MQENANHDDHSYLNLLYLNHDCDGVQGQGEDALTSTFPAGWVPFRTLAGVGMSRSELADWCDRNWLSHAHAETDGQVWNARLARGTFVTNGSWFRLTDEGYQNVTTRLKDDRSRLHPAATIPAFAPIPVWNRQSGELTLDGVLIKRFRRRATAQFEILDAFQAAGWPTEIGDPIACAATIEVSDVARDAIKSLNKNMRVKLLRFGVCQQGQRLYWALCSADKPKPFGRSPRRAKRSRLASQ